MLLFRTSPRTTPASLPRHQEERLYVLASHASAASKQATPCYCSERRRVLLRLPRHQEKLLFVLARHAPAASKQANPCYCSERCRILRLPRHQEELLNILARHTSAGSLYALRVCRAAPLLRAEAGLVRGYVLNSSKGVLALVAQRELQEVHEVFEERVGFQLRGDRRYMVVAIRRCVGGLGERSVTPDSVEPPTRVSARFLYFIKVVVNFEHHSYGGSS